MIFGSLVAAVSLSSILAIAPLPLGLSLLLARVFLALQTAIMVPTWVGLIIFLIYVGGLLVIFSYFIAIQPNQQLGAPIIIFITLISFPLFLFMTRLSRVVNTSPTFVTSLLS